MPTSGDLKSGNRPLFIYPATPSPQWHKSIQFPDYNMGMAQDIIQSLTWSTVQIIKIRFVDERLVSDKMSLKVAQKPYYEQENINFKLWEGDELVTCRRFVPYLGEMA